MYNMTETELDQYLTENLSVDAENYCNGVVRVTLSLKGKTISKSSFSIPIEEPD